MYRDNGFAVFGLVFSHQGVPSPAFGGSGRVLRSNGCAITAAPAHAGWAKQKKPRRSSRPSRFKQLFFNRLIQKNNPTNGRAAFDRVEIVSF
jgi:hypothetical protein